MKQLLLPIFIFVSLGLVSPASVAFDRTQVVDDAANVSPLLIGQLDALGYQILAISPETPSQLQAQKLQEKFTVRLLSDSALDTIKGFGIAFYVDEQTTSKYKSSWDIDLNQQDTSGKAVLPAPAVFILDTKGKVKFSFVNPDFKERLSPELLLSAAKLVL